MKTLLITLLTTALLSFNSFADTTSDIQEVANAMAKENLQQMNVKFTNDIDSDIKRLLNFIHIAKHNEPEELIAKLNIKKSESVKNIAQASDE